MKGVDAKSEKSHTVKDILRKVNLTFLKNHVSGKPSL